jgi:biotin transport system substrate-specific component
MPIVNLWVVTVYILRIVNYNLFKVYNWDGGIFMRSKTAWLLLAGLFTALTAVGAFLKIPVGLAAVSLQSLVTALAGLLLGAKWGALSQAAYVVLGLVGLPIFALGGGLGYVFQPSFGFVLALIPAAWVIGIAAGKRPSAWRCVAACLLGECVIYLVGVPYLYVILHAYLGQDVPLSSVIKTGMLIYLPGDGVKILATVLLVGPLRRALSRTGT